MLQSGVAFGKKQPAMMTDDFSGHVEVDDEKTARVRDRLIDHLKDMGHKFHSYTMMEMVSAATTDWRIVVRMLACTLPPVAQAATYNFVICKPSFHVRVNSA